VIADRLAALIRDVIGIAFWRRDFEALDMDPGAVPLIFKDNALRVLGIKR
jgi:uncharacterized protein